MFLKGQVEKREKAARDVLDAAKRSTDPKMQALYKSYEQYKKVVQDLGGK